MSIVDFLASGWLGFADFTGLAQLVEFRPTGRAQEVQWIRVVVSEESSENVEELGAYQVRRKRILVMRTSDLVAHPRERISEFVIAGIEYVAELVELGNVFTRVYIRSKSANSYGGRA